MLIGIDASRANRPHKSGTEWYAYHLIRTLATIDSVNTYLLYSDKPLSGGLMNLSSDFDTDDNQSPNYDQDGLQIITSPHNNFKAKIINWPFKFFWTLGGLSLEMLFHKPDVLFVPSHTLPLIQPRRSFVTIHDIGFKRQVKLYSPDNLGYRGGLLNFLVQSFTGGRYQATHLDYLDWSTKFALKHCHKIITISNFSKQEIIDVYDAKADQIEVVHNGYDNRVYHPSQNSHSNQILANHGISKPYLFYVGRLEKKKNTATLIHAFSLLKQQHPELEHDLVLVGDASYGYDEIKYSISEFGLDQKVILTGWVDEADMPTIFQNADCFVFPTNYEGFGIPLLQAMASGTAITASDIAPVREVVGDSALLFNPDQAQDIADKLFIILSDQHIRQTLIQSGLRQASNFSWTKCAQETLAILQS